VRVGGVVAWGAGVAAITVGGIGWLIARRLTAPPSGRTFDLTVLAVVPHEDRQAVVLDRTARAAAAGLYNLWIEGGGWVRLGEVVHEDETTVTRVIEGEAPADLSAGKRASWSGIYYRDPGDAGMGATDVVIKTAVGSAPAWLIEQAGGTDRWAIHIHGLGSPRAGTLRGVRVAASAGLTSLVVSYRNDGEGPTVGSGRSMLGVTESDDVRSALRYAIAQGARRVVLFGWSMGAAIALQLAAIDEFHGVIEMLVLESPVLDWQSTINANCARAGLPPWLGALARPWLQGWVLSRMIGLGSPAPLDSFDWIGRANKLRVPMLILHGVDDTSTPYQVSRLVADLRPDLVRLELFRADHTMCWNAEPERWRLVVRESLASHADSRT
jgi:pimeloyl-ACP methyl ester carboxylesterase